MFADAWSRPITRHQDRAIIGKIRRPVISELHKAIGQRSKIKADDATEANIAATFVRNGAPSDGQNYRRITCRTNLCEIVLVLKKDIAPNVARRTFDSINKSSRELCNEVDCVSTVLMTSGNKFGDGTSLLMYFIPLNQGFL